MTDSLVLEIDEVIKTSPKRRFCESVDLSVVLKGIDLKRNPDMKINEVVELEYPPKNKKVKVCVFGTGEFALKAKEVGADKVMDAEEIKKLSGDKKALKKLAAEYDFFIAQADLLPKIARVIGPIFGPRNKMPITLPVTALDRLPDLIERLRRSVRIRMRDQPYFHVKIGSVDMSPEEIAANVRKVMSVVRSKYGDIHYVDKVYIKTTMGPARKIDVKAVS